MNLTEEEFEREIRKEISPLLPSSMRSIVCVLKSIGVEFKEVPQRPRTGDYDLNDEFEMMKYVSELTDYTNYLETKI